MSQPEFAYVQGLILGLLTVWGLAWLGRGTRKRPPICHSCGYRCKPISPSLPIDRDGRVTCPDNARWFCGGGCDLTPHQTIYYMDPKPEGVREL